jgi:hypothetical protein
MDERKPFLLAEAYVGVPPTGEMSSSMALVQRL